MKITESYLRKIIRQEILKEQETQFVRDPPTDAGHMMRQLNLKSSKINQVSANITVEKILMAIMPIVHNAMQQSWIIKQGVQPQGSNKRFIWDENTENKYQKMWAQMLLTVVEQFSNNPKVIPQQALNATVSDMKGTIWGEAITPQVEAQALKAIQTVVNQELYKKHK